MFSKKSKEKDKAAQGRQPATPVMAQSNGGQPNGAATGAAVSVEDIKASFERSCRTLAALGEITSVLMKAPEYRSLTLANLQALAGPAISTGQYMVLTAHQKDRGAAAPVAVAMWAKVSNEIDRRLTQGDASPLTPGDWKSGENIWLIAAAGDQRALPALLSQLQRNQFKNRPVKTRVKGEDGKMQARTLPAAPPAPAQGRAATQPAKA